MDIFSNTINRLLSKLAESRAMQHFRYNATPRWLVLMLDLFIVLMSVVVGSLLSNYALTEPHELLPLVAGWIVTLGVALAWSLIFKSYAFVIRLSMVEDIYKLLIMNIATAVTMLLINWASGVLNMQLLPYRGIVTSCAISVVTMLAERLLIKHLYASLVHNRTQAHRVMVLGSGMDSLTLVNALKSEIQGKYLPVALLSTKPNVPKGKTVNRLPVVGFNTKTLAAWCEKKGIYALVFDQAHIDWVRSDGVADYFMQHHIALRVMRSTERFDANASRHINHIEIEDLLGRKPIVLNNATVSNTFKDSCVLVTGACGSIGSEIVRQLAAYHARRIVLVDQAETPMHDIKIEFSERFPNADIVLFMGDVTNRERMERAFATYKPQYVFHAAAYKHVPMMELNPTEAVLTNVGGTRIIADLALRYGVRKFVMVSTDKAVNPSNIMGCTKRLAEIYVQSLSTSARLQGHGTQFITTRFGNVLGSNGSVIPLFRRQIEHGGPVTVTHRDIIRYFMTIPEACSLVLEAGCMGHGGEIYIFDMGQPVKIYDLAKRMILLSGLRLGKDISIKEVGLRPGEKLYEELLADKETTISTANSKIMIAKVRTYDDFQAVCRNLDHIVRYAQEGNVHHMVKLMKEFVPEFHSRHSEFEKIDAEVAAEKH